MLFAYNSICGGNWRNANAGSLAQPNRYDYAADYRVAFACGSENRRANDSTHNSADSRANAGGYPHCRSASYRQHSPL